MPRRQRLATAGLTFHVMNRGAKRAPLFEDSADYAAFIRILGDGLERFAIELFAYCLMWNHWHLVLSPQKDGALSRFMHWLTMTHARRWQTFRRLDGQGAVYQGRFKAVAVCDDEHFLWVCRYVERNPVRASLVESCEQWRWSSVSQRMRGDPQPRLADWRVHRPVDWTTRVNAPQTVAELEAVRAAIRMGQPFGDDTWRELLELRNNGRPGRRRRGRPAASRGATVLRK